MTWIDLVKYHIPDASDREADCILWEKTAFPLVDRETVEKQIIKFKEEREELIRKEGSRSIQRKSHFVK